MKIKCIANYVNYITVGKTYDVIYIFSNGDYGIIDDKGNQDWYYPKSYFKPVSEIRNETINKLLEDES